MLSDWQRLAEPARGTVVSLAYVQAGAGPAFVFAGAATGVHASTDVGHTWRRLGDGSEPVLVQVVAPSPDLARDGRLFAAGRCGLYSSADHGRTWCLQLASEGVLAVAVSPQFGAAPSLLVGTAADGALASHDGGATWVSANPGLRDGTVSALALSPEFNSDGVAFAGTPSGLYVSRNGGKSWRWVDLDDQDVGVECLAVAPDFARSGQVLAGTEAGLLRSGDGGRTWQPVPEIADEGVTAVAFAAEPGLAVAATASGVALTADGGDSWQGTAAVPGVPLSVAYPGRGGLLVGLLRQGVARSTGDGAPWIDAGLRTSLLTELACSPEFPTDHTLFAAGVDAGVHVSRDGGQTWTGADGESAEMVVLGLVMSPRYASDLTLYAATDSGLSRSLDGGRTWRRVAPWERVTAVAIVPRLDVPAVVAAVPEVGIARSSTAGTAWSVTEAPFGAAEVTSFGLVGHASTVLATTRAQAAPREVWCSPDGGERWQRVFVAPTASRAPLVLARWQPESRPLLVGDGPHLYEVPVTRPVARLAGSITGLAWSPSGGELFVASSAGVHVSSDGGRTFNACGEGGPRVVMAVAVSMPSDGERCLFALELGGTVWRCGPAAERA